MNYLQKSLSQKKNLGINIFFRSFTSTIAGENEANVSGGKTSEHDQILNPILNRTLEFCPKHLTPRQVWVENIDEVKEKKEGLIDLHPKIFGTMPRLDLIFDNLKWQRLYKNVVLYSAKTTIEMPGGGRKPRPQKGMGKSRQGSIRAPQFLKGGTCHGPRNPTSYFYMLPWQVRLHGLTSTLSAKFAQDDLHVVKDLHIPTDDSQFILDLIKERNWGPSVLIADVNDIMPRNITVATETIGHVNLMPVYGLNVYGMLKHDTLVLTVAAVEQIEESLLKLLNTPYDRHLTKEFNPTFK